MKKVYSFLILLLWLLPGTACFAQNEIASNENLQMANGLRASGKIYVVVVVVVTILLGFVLYLIHLDRKISRLEKEPGSSAVSSETKA
ncbi:MAG: CcmD family protein [Chitinophagaceae bacterium]